MSLFLLFNIPLILLTILLEKCQKKADFLPSYSFISFAFGFGSYFLIFVNLQIFFSLSLTTNYLSFKNYCFKEFFVENIFLIIIPSIIFLKFYTMRASSIFKNNLIYTITFIGGIIFASNFKAFINASAIYSINEYILLPFLKLILFLIIAKLLESLSLKETLSKNNLRILAEIILSFISLALLNTFHAFNMFYLYFTLFILINLYFYYLYKNDIKEIF